MRLPNCAPGCCLDHRCEGGPEDALTFIDGALLVDLWDELVLPTIVRRAWQPPVKGTCVSRSRRTDLRLFASCEFLAPTVPPQDSSDLRHSGA